MKDSILPINTLWSLGWLGPNGASKSVKGGALVGINMKIIDGAAGLLGINISNEKKALLSDLKKWKLF